MTKRSLTAALAVAAEPKPASKKLPSRRGKRAWVVYLDPGTARCLKAVAALNDRSLQDRRGCLYPGGGEGRPESRELLPATQNFTEVAV